MINRAPGPDVGQSFERLKMTPFLFVEPCRQRLFDDPGARSVESFSSCINLFREVQRYMGGENPGGHGASNHDDWL